MSSVPGTVATLSTRALVSPEEYRDALDIDVKRVLSQTAAIKRLLDSVMIKDVHYGVIPGTDKPTLLQPGADKLCMLFRLRPRYRTRIVTRRDFISVESTCRLIHIPTQEEWGEGQGWANSREEKYVNQVLQRVCPTCSKPALMRSKYEDRDGSKGWYCNPAKGGCGANHKAKDPAIENQAELISGDRVWNLANTILKISNKRSRVAGILTCTGAADIFTQDLDHLMDAEDALEEDRLARQQAGNGTSAPAANGANGAAAPAPAVAKGSNGAGAPAPAGNGNAAAATPAATNGNGAKRAGPLQIRELRGALGGKLQVTEPERQIAWCNGMLPGGRTIASFNDLTPEETVKLTKAAENGEVPGGAEK